MTPSLSGVSNSLQETVLHGHAKMLPGVTRPSLLPECQQTQGNPAPCSISTPQPDLQAPSPPVMSSLFLKRKRMSSWYRADSLFFKRWASSTIM